MDVFDTIVRHRSRGLSRAERRQLARHVKRHRKFQEASGGVVMMHVYRHSFARFDWSGVKCLICSEKFSRERGPIDIIALAPVEPEPKDHLEFAVCEECSVSHHDDEGLVLAAVKACADDLEFFVVAAQVFEAEAAGRA